MHWLILPNPVRSHTLPAWQQVRHMAPRARPHAQVRLHGHQQRGYAPSPPAATGIADETVGCGGLTEQIPHQGLDPQCKPPPLSAVAPQSLTMTYPPQPSSSRSGSCRSRRKRPTGVSRLYTRAIEGDRGQGCEETKTKHVHVETSIPAVLARSSLSFLWFLVRCSV